MKARLYNLIRSLVIIGNGAYILFLLYNGIDEGFKGNLVTTLAPLGLVLLLILNIFLLYQQRNK